MSGVSPEPLALELALARYVASMPEGGRIPLDELAAGFGCAVEDIGMALAPIVEVEDSCMTCLSYFVIEDGCLVKRGDSSESLAPLLLVRLHVIHTSLSPG